VKIRTCIIPLFSIEPEANIKKAIKKYNHHFLKKGEANE